MSGLRHIYLALAGAHVAIKFAREMGLAKWRLYRENADTKSLEGVIIIPDGSAYCFNLDAFLAALRERHTNYEVIQGSDLVIAMELAKRGLARRAEA